MIPRSRFITKDQQMVTVPSCARCQREKSYGDDDLRDFVNLDWAGSHHPDAPEQVERIARATLLERSKFGQAFQRGGQEQDLTTTSGLYLGEAYAVPIDNADLLKTMEYIVRGLYSEEMREPLPELTPVAVKYVPPLEAHELLVKIPVLPHRGPTVKGNLVAWWASFYPGEDPLTTMWLIVFNDRVNFLGMTGRLAHRELERCAAADVPPTA